MVERSVVETAERLSQKRARMLPFLAVIYLCQQATFFSGDAPPGVRPVDHVGIGTDNGVLPQSTDAEATRKLNEWAKQRMDAGIAAPGEGLNIWPMVADYNSVDRYRRLGSDLQKRGWSEARLEKLFGGNFLRIYREAWGG